MVRFLREKIWLLASIIQNITRAMKAFGSLILSSGKEKMCRSRKALRTMGERIEEGTVQAGRLPLPVSM